MKLNRLCCYNAVKVGKKEATFFSIDAGYIIELDVKTQLIRIENAQGAVTYTSLHNVPWFSSVEPQQSTPDPTPSAPVISATKSTSPRKKQTKKKTTKKKD